MNEIYQNNEILNYLRYNPEWYKILYYEKSINSFLNKAKNDLKITFVDKLDSFKNQLDFVLSLIEYINKK